MNWTRKFEKARTLAHSIGSALSDRDAIRNQGGRPDKAILNIRRNLDRLGKSVVELSDALNDCEKDRESGRTVMTKQEIVRRRKLLQQLVQQKDELERKEGEFVVPGRSALVGEGKRARHVEERDDTRGKNDRDLLRMQQRKVQDQDKALDVLSDGMDTLINYGSAISDEAGLHVRLLDDIQDDVENGDARFREETVRAKDVQEKEAFGRYYLAICFLLACIVVVVVVRWG